ncbi:MAG: alanine--tRNA ligase [Candidatus Promineifilaceae bacterium]|nr:alanine--tRNA ligase [Candidatus Promineifilaceae bacterium]
MKPTTSNEIRQAFLDFFAEFGHEVVSSSPLPLYDNPTLLFTNAGMNQFTDVFLGKEKRVYKRAATAQKCMRVTGKHNDLENVGPSPRHHTFFEMMGNFSFGDYFKKEAIRYGWDFVTSIMGLEPERLWATIYDDDDESFELWQEYLPAEKILRFGKSDNFWEMGDVGPCGPNSEIFYYIGDMDNCDPSRLNAEDDEEFLEFWNLVFMQFNREEDGSLTPLPKPSVDTGLGLERLARIMQGAENNYETDLFLPAMDRVQELLGDADEDRRENYVGYRVIADHGRAATFLVADGVRPGSTGAGYVLRMLIRRAARFGRQIGFQQPFLAEIAKVYIAEMGDAYPELMNRRDQILHTLTQEEERFIKTLDAALVRLLEILEEKRQRGEHQISGDEAFNLYATYGLPVEITRDILQGHGFTIDEAGYNRARQAHAVASGSGAFGKYQTDDSVYGDLLHDLTEKGHLEDGVEYDPYYGSEMSSEIVGLLQDGRRVDRIQSGEKAEVITAATPFYVEAGGEISDTGRILSQESGAEFLVEDMASPLPGIVVHIGRLISGALDIGSEVLLQVDDRRRSDIRRNHTATHLLHRELRSHLGTHVQQAGSLVAPDRLRFDFTHGEAVDRETLAAIEADINQVIMANYPVAVNYMGQKEAIAQGAMALFGEKYGDIVRTISITKNSSKKPFSFELCGGLHVSETNDIGQFRFVSEGAVAAGVRRVEAVTGSGAQQLVADRLNILERVSQRINSPVSEVEKRVESLLSENKLLQKQIGQMQSKLARAQFNTLLTDIRQVDGVNVLAAQVDVDNVDSLREMADWFRDKVGSGVALLATMSNGKPVMIASVTEDLIDRGVHAGNLVREVAKIVGGGGGGRPNMAQAGGRHPDKLPQALAAVPDLVQETLNSS